MLLRICLILTIVAGLATAYLAFVPVQDIITTTRAVRDDNKKNWDREAGLHKKFETSFNATKKELDSTTAKLTETTTQLEAANNKNTELDKQNTDLTDKLTKLTAHADAADQKLAQWDQLPPPEKIHGIIAELAQTKKEVDALVAESKILVAKRDDLQKQLNDLIGNTAPPPAMPGLKGLVMAVDPKYDFVVLNVGDDQGAKERGELMVDRKGKLIGKVKITSVGKDQCIASIMSDWKRGSVKEGDQVIY